jgi:hypothetical protein
VEVFSSLEERRNTNHALVEGRSKLVDRRVEIIEKCMQAVSLAGRAQTLVSYNALQSKRFEELRAANAKLDAYAPTIFTPEMQKELAEIQSMQFMCVHAGTIFFGPKSKDAGQALGRDPAAWTVTGTDLKPEFHEFLADMISEVQVLNAGQ